MQAEHCFDYAEGSFINGKVVRLLHILLQSQESIPRVSLYK